MKKPKYLYHASPIKNLTEIIPRANTLPKDFDNGPVVFATPYFSFATQFLVPHDESWAIGNAFGDTCFFVISDKDRFSKLDVGGTIYFVSSKKFTRYNNKEWYSPNSVRPRQTVTFSSGLSAMITHNVQVYFVDKATYKNINKSADHGLSILNTLTSENEKWGRKVVKFDMYKGSKLKRINS